LSDGYAKAAARIVALLGEAGCRLLLNLLEQDDEVRAYAFRQLHERGRSRALLDALADLGAYPVMRGWFVEHLRMELGELETRREA
jgi:hypothetical protein